MVWWRSRYSVSKPAAGTWVQPLSDHHHQTLGLNLSGSDRTARPVDAREHPSSQQDVRKEPFPTGGTRGHHSRLGSGEPVAIPMLSEHHVEITIESQASRPGVWTTDVKPPSHTITTTPARNGCVPPRHIKSPLRLHDKLCPAQTVQVPGSLVYRVFMDALYIRTHICCHTWPHTLPVQS